MKTLQYDGTSSELPNILAEIETAGLFVWDVRFSNWKNDNGEVTGSRIDIDVDEIPPENKRFFTQIETPALYAQDIFVTSRDIKDDPDEAFVEAKAETEKSKGAPKSLDLISRSTLKAVEKAREEIGDLKQKLRDRTDEINLLKRELKTITDEIKEIKKKLK